MLILFINTKITDESFPQISTYPVIRYNRGNLNEYNKLDIFKYCLSSLAVIDWVKVFIYYELDGKYKGCEQELEEYVCKYFVQPNIYNMRLDTQKEWKKALTPVLDINQTDFIWYLCNHDHIFIDYSIELLKQIVIGLKVQQEQNKYVSCYFSHWPEMCFRRIKDFRSDNKNYFVVDWGTPDSVQIVNKNLLRYWWFEQDHGNKIMFRSDAPHGLSVKCPSTVAIIPYRELCRHFDGYVPFGVDMNLCSPLEIPPGFFNNDVKLYFGSDKPPDGYVYCNPLSTTLKAMDRLGADYRWVVDDVPLFWRCRISNTIYDFSDDDYDLLIRARNKAMLDTIKIKLQWDDETIKTKFSLVFR